MLVLHHKGHLLHGDIEFDFRHIHINENDKAIRRIDFDHSASYKCSQTGEIEMYNYQPSRSTFNCGELYQAFCRIGAWTPGMHDLFVRYVSSNISLPADRIRFAGRPIQIFRAPTVKHPMKMHNHFYPRTKEPISSPRRSESSISTIGCTVRDSKLLAALYSSSYISGFLRCQTARMKATSLPDTGMEACYTRTCLVIFRLS